MYSRSPPTGTPLAILLTLIPVGLISLLIYIAVVSPSNVELVAIITTSSQVPLCVVSFRLYWRRFIPYIPKKVTTTQIADDSLTSTRYSGRRESQEHGVYQVLYGGMKKAVL